MSDRAHPPLQLEIDRDAAACGPWRSRRSRRRGPSLGGWAATATTLLSAAGVVYAGRQKEHNNYSDRPTQGLMLQHYRRHLYDPLNTTRIELNPFLSRRYRWLRQSPELTRLVDENSLGGTMNQRSAKDNGWGHRVLADYADDATNDDVNSNVYAQAYDDAYVAAADDAAATDDAAAAADDAYVVADDAAAADDDAAAANDDYTDDAMSFICEDKTCTVNEKCTKFLFGFLEGTTDAKDNCEGIMNAYLAADCGTIRKSGSSSKKDTTIYNMDDDFNDDYFGVFYDHQCCSSLRSHYYEYCDATEMLNGYNLLIVAGVMLLCECAKSVVKKNRIRWLPEAAACMLVGVAVAMGAQLVGSSIENIGFDEEIFMYLLLPPIIFEAALSVNKKEFRRRRGAIMVFAVFGTLLSSFVTGAATYYSAKYFGDESLSVLDSMVFGSLISSIDPVAILSVLTNLKMSETDTIYILVFGESLLNDGIAITLFKSLVQQYDNKSSISVDEVLGSVADFLIIAFGSCAIGLACGIACLCYFHLNSSILHPVMEVASFFLWAVVPYWMAEAFGWSGIVSIVVMGFFMDIYLRPGWDPAELELEEERRQLMLAAQVANNRNNGLEDRAPKYGSNGLEYYNWDDDDNDGRFRFRGTAVDIPRPQPASHPPPPGPEFDLKDRDRSESSRTSKAGNLARKDGDGNSVSGTSMTTNPNIKAILMKREFVRMSREADEHVRFVAHILSSLSENAIFAYLGLFLFSSKYEWDGVLCSIGVASCILSRALMVICASWFIWYMHVFRQRMGCNKDATNYCHDDDESTKETTNNRHLPMRSSSEITGDYVGGTPVDPLNTPVSKSARALSNYKVQVVLILAGLRGAVSLALVESVPIYNGVTGVGSKNKPLLKAMTSAAIIFTIMVLGGGAYYILKWLDISSDDMLIKSSRAHKNSRSNYGEYLYPTMVCGGQDQEYPETELSSAPSWRSHPHTLPLSPSPRVPSPRVASPHIGQSWSHSDAGLNDIGDRVLPQVPSVGSSKSSDRSGGRPPSPALPPQIV